MAPLDVSVRSVLAYWKKLGKKRRVQLPGAAVHTALAQLEKREREMSEK